jgi:hypothetical protein
VERRLLWEQEFGSSILSHARGANMKLVICISSAKYIIPDDKYSTMMEFQEDTGEVIDRIMPQREEGEGAKSWNIEKKSKKK